MKILLLSFFVKLCFGAKVLVVVSHDTGSHLLSIIPYLERLAKSGHEVNILNTIHKDASKLQQKFHTIDLFIPFKNSNENAAKELWLDYFKASDFIERHPMQDQFFGYLIQEHKEKLDELMAQDWDLLILDELLAPIAYSIGLRLYKERGIKYVLYPTCGEQTASSMEERSMGRNPVQKSIMFPSPPVNSKEYFKPTSFYYRLYSFAHVFYEVFGFHWIVAPYYMPNIKKFGVEDFSWQNLYKGAALTFSDSFDRLGWPTSEGTDFINTGSYCKRTEVLEGEFKEFVEDPQSNGTIYIALGTYANWQFAPEHVLRAFSNGLQRFPQYRIIMSFNGDFSKMPNQPFIKLVKWAPQTAILNHPKTRVFISHGGMKSIKESLCSKTPLILMPMGAEQGHNAHMFLSLDYGRVLNKFTVTEEQVYSEINEMLQNPKFQQKSNKLHDIMLDRPIPALDLALFYTERVIRAPNNEVAFKRKGIDLYWHEYLYAQLAFMLFAMIMLFK